MKISMIKDWVEVLLFVFFWYFATATSLSIMDFLGPERFKLQPREEEHHAEKDDTHGARQADVAISDRGVIEIQSDDVDRLDGSSPLGEEVLGTERFQALKHGHDGDQHRRWLQEGKRYVKEIRPSACTICSCSFVDALGDGSQSNEKDNCKVAYVFPEVDHHRRDLNHGRIGKPLVINARST